MINRDGRGIGLYIHIPFCLSKCRYCGFYSVPLDDALVERTIKAVLAELERVELSAVDTVYIGGGTPTCIRVDKLLAIIDFVRSRAKNIREFTVEANPGQLLTYPLVELRCAGADRLSIGVQSFDPEDLNFLGRRHTADDACESIFAAREAGFSNISADLIFAVPGSSPQAWLKTLRRTISLSPDHISAYSLSYEEQTPLRAERDRNAFAVTDEETDARMYDMAIDELSEAGYHWYEISNFASPARECMHNLKYWANDEYIGVGPGAGGWYGGIRYTNVGDIEAYTEGISLGKNVRAEEERPSPIEAACETAVLNLRRRGGIDPSVFKARTGFDPMVIFGGAIEKYIELGLISAVPGRIALSRAGAAVADSILVDFASVLES